MNQHKWEIFGFIVFCCMMLFYTASTSQLVCDNNTCYIKDYNGLRQNISTRKIDLDNIDHFESVRKRPFLSKHSGYFINAVNKNGKRVRVFKSSNRHRDRSDIVVNILNEKLNQRDYSSLDVYYPYSIYQ